jgi:hypothetical protein
LEDFKDEDVGQNRLILALLGSFAGIAVVLALTGIYGVIANSVLQRTSEIGIRRALGAQARRSPGRSPRTGRLDCLLPQAFEWFGILSFREVGVVSREVRYKISVLEDRTNKALDARRKGTSFSPKSESDIATD